MTTYPIDRDWFFSMLEQRKISVRQLAKLMELDPSAVSRMLNGKRAMTADEQDQIAEVLGLQIEDIAAHRKGTALKTSSSGAPSAAPSQVAEARLRGFGEVKQAVMTPDGESDFAHPSGERVTSIGKHPLFGALKGTTIVAPGVDITAPTGPLVNEQDAKKRGRHPAWGAMKGTFTLSPDVDLTEPADPEWGKVYED
jgi:transcriptional regulator with XRE-family HTH domain